MKRLNTAITFGVGAATAVGFSLLKVNKDFIVGSTAVVVGAGLMIALRDEDDPNKEGEHIGPVISETQFNKIQGLIQKGIDEGAKLVSGGPGKPDGLKDGYYVKPTVFADVNNSMNIARTEIFGPVLSVIPFETEEEAIEIANDTDYGLTNYIQTQDGEKVQRVARKLRSGMVDVNGAGIAVDAPFGGYKHSGIGREAGKEGLIEFLEVKSVGGWS